LLLGHGRGRGGRGRVHLGLLGGTCHNQSNH
jgi:hypothetical protein